MNNTAQNCDNDALSGPVGLSSPLHIGAIRLPNRIFLAPMSGVTDLPFRNRACDAGAGLVVSEMVASREFVQGSPESQMRAERGNAPIHMVQLAGREAYWMGEAARMLEQGGADIIDINMGCPAKKVTGGYSGSALMRDLDHALTLIEATVKAVTVPVTLKMRLGWDENSLNAPQLARSAQDAGVQLITVHGRTRCQFYTGKADWNAIADVRTAITVPLVVNGDIQSLRDAENAMESSQADAVMTGRAHYGQPWFAGLLAWQAGGEIGQSPIPFNPADYVIAHYADMLSHYGREIGIRHARKHLAAYLEKLTPNCAGAIKSTLLQSADEKAVRSLIQNAFDSQSDSTRKTGLAA